MSTLFESANVTLQAIDFDASLKFYTEVLGFTRRYEVVDVPTGRWVELESSGLSIGLHEATGPCKSLAVESNFSLPEHAARIGFSVGNLDQAKQELETRGVKFSGEFDLPFIRFAFFADPSGNPCYLAQLKSASCPGQTAQTAQTEQ
jgi:catechol 2,3-dioxygenase-like lactoylglutathione lyase family enzyme